MLLESVLPDPSTKVATISSVPAPPESEYVKEALPTRSVTAVPVVPALGPVDILKVMVRKPGGAPSGVWATTLTVCEPPTGSVAVRGVSVRTIKGRGDVVSQFLTTTLL